MTALTKHHVEALLRFWGQYSRARADGGVGWAPTTITALMMEFGGDPPRSNGLKPDPMLRDVSELGDALERVVVELTHYDPTMGSVIVERFAGHGSRDERSSRAGVSAREYYAISDQGVAWVAGRLHASPEIYLAISE